ncbi:hypertrehalosaemic prohormone [Folsomia candida]|uniref:hypertrehalosaemic prohormone n=1 Tax=Folsomia candida TaxID=158441 RepID=UPI000B8FADE7|nr:hypertrehalosaemic prohormone [Folsomia candida]
MKSNNVTTTLLWGAFLFLAVVALTVQAQVNFSPAWGKRGHSIPVSVQSRNGGDATLGSDHLQNLSDCKLPFEGVVRVLKLIQIEAQRLVRCEAISQDSTD